jgi:hypothetical protein
LGRFFDIIDIAINYTTDFRWRVLIVAFPWAVNSCARSMVELYLNEDLVGCAIGFFIDPLQLSDHHLLCHSLVRWIILLSQTGMIVPAKRKVSK